MWQRYYGRFGDLGQSDNFEHCLQVMLASNAVQALSPDEKRIRDKFWRGLPTYGRLFAILHEHFAESAGKCRWGAQIGLIEDYADVIFNDYPDARMIHMVRDPRTRQQQAANHHCQRTGRTGWEIAKWLHSAGLAERNEARYPGRYLVISSESLLADREATLQRICEFLGEAYEPAMLTMEKAIRFGDSKPASGAEPTSKPPSRPIPPRDLAFAQAYAGRHIVHLGYDLKPVHLPLREQVLFNFLDRPANLASMFAWRTLQTIRS